MHIDQIWNEPSGTTIGNVVENTIVSLQLPISEPTAEIKVISGKLPKGTRLVGQQIVGTPTEVAYETKYRFVLRASFNNNIYDRTFNIVVDGSDIPVWKTPEDLLPAGNNNTYYVLDNSVVDFQLVVEDPDINAGQILEFYIKPSSGILPPGLSLTKDGKIQGIVDPILAIEKSITGGYDIGAYDFETNAGYDWFGALQKTSAGFDSYFYDLVQYDIDGPAKAPRKLNRYFQFTVSVTDGQYVIDRTFRIYVIGDDFFTADVTAMQAGTGTFTADVSKLRNPIWLTPENFGYRRANNYISLPLQVINNDTLGGFVWYRLEDVNNDGSDSILPPGLGLDFRNGYIVGRSPYQPYLTKEYKFTISAIRVNYDDESVELQQTTTEDTPFNSATIKISKLEKVTALDIINKSFTVLGHTYKILSADLSNSEYDKLTLTYGTRSFIPKGTEINLGFFVLSEVEEAKATKTFKVNLLGETNSSITWQTDSNLGSVSANYVSTKNIKAISTTGSNVFYTVQSGSLPPGLQLNLEGELIGTVKSYGSIDAQGLTVFDSGDTQFDGNTTRLDRKFEFTVAAKDYYGLSLNTRTFSIVVDDPNDKQYSNIFMKPLLQKTLRQEYRNIINDPSIFKPEWLYRPDDKNFGIQDDPKILVYSGIETKDINHYVAASNLYAKRKTYKIGNLKTAIAMELGTQNPVYEVVYLDLIDDNIPKKGRARKIYTDNSTVPLLINSSHFSEEVEYYDSKPYTISVVTRETGTEIIEYYVYLPIETRDNGSLIWSLDNNNLFIESQLGNILDVDLIDAGANTAYKIRPNTPNVVTVDLDLYTIDSVYKNKRSVSSIKNLREEIFKIGETEKDFLPLWMQTPQSSIAEIGYVPSLVLCYCKPGTSEKIKELIENNNINFKQFELDVDRLIIDNSESRSDEQYIVLQNKEYVV